MRTFIRKKSAFTLIELLVVIVVIAIIAAIALPVMGSAKKSANQVKSASNLRQWGVALGLSLSDNNNMLPWEGQPVRTTDAAAWYNRLPPYLGEKPYSARKPTEFPRAGQKSIFINPQVPTSVNATYNPYLFCYAMNYYLSTSSAVGQPGYTISMLSIFKPSATVFMGESTDNFANLNPTYTQAYFGPGDPLKDVRNMANFVFLDGHVKAYTRQEFDPEYNPKVVSKNPVNNTLTFIPYDGVNGG